MLKRAQRSGLSSLDDSKGDVGLDPGLKGTLLDPSAGASIMDRVNRRQAQQIDDRLAGDDADEEDEEGEEDDDDDDDGGGGGGEEVAQFYEDEIQRRVDEKRRRRRAAKAERDDLDKARKGGRDALGRNQEGEIVDGHRMVSKEITTNRGLTAKRPRKFKNPRVRSKHRAHKQEVRRRSQVKSVVKPLSSYQGERQIRTDVVRSHKMRH